MATRLVYGIGILAAVIEGLAPGAVPGGLLPLIMVVAGVAYAVMNIDAASPQAFLTTALVVAAAGGADVLSNVQAVGSYLDAIVDQVAVVYLSGGAAVMGVRAFNLISKGSV